MSRLKLGAIVGAVGVAALLAIAAVAFSLRGDDEPAPRGGDNTERRRPPAGFDRSALQEFRNCLRDQGVELPQGPPGGGGPPPGLGSGDGATRKAFQACRDKLPQGGAPPGGAPPGGGAPGGVPSF